MHRYIIGNSVIFFFNFSLIIIKNDEKTVTNKVESVSVKLQEFWESDPETWLKTAEYQFRLAGIVNEETKYYHIASRLPSTFYKIVKIMNNLFV